MHRAVITGAGIVSGLGNSLSEVEATLRSGQPRIEAVPSFGWVQQYLASLDRK